MVRVDGPLVPEEDVDFAPVEFVGVVAGERLIGPLRGRAAGERDGEAAAFVYRRFGPEDEIAGGSLGEFFWRFVDEEVQRSRISTAARRAVS